MNGVRLARTEPAAERELVPATSMASLMISLLIVTVTAGSLAVFEASAQRPSGDPGEERLILRVDSRGFLVELEPEGGQLRSEIARISCAGRCGGVGDYDWIALRTSLEEGRARGATTLVVRPSNELPYDVFVGALGAGRARRLSFGQVLVAGESR